MRRVRSIVVGMLVLLATACGSADPEAPPASRSAEASPPSVGASPSVEVRPLVWYARDEGGTAGRVELTVRADGGYELVRDGATVRGALAEGELADLRAALARSGFADIPSVNSVTGDGPTHTVTYAGHSVLADAANPPAALRPVLAAVDSIVARHR